MKTDFRNLFLKHFVVTKMLYPTLQMNGGLVLILKAVARVVFFLLCEISVQLQLQFTADGRESHLKK